MSGSAVHSALCSFQSAFWHDTLQYATSLHRPHRRKLLFSSRNVWQCAQRIERHDRPSSTACCTTDRQCETPKSCSASLRTRKIRVSGKRPTDKLVLRVGRGLLMVH